MRLRLHGCWRALQATIGCLIVVMTCVDLVACAPGDLVRGARADLVTDSDETLPRKRARIRLELALGYFENGQTTIALDELKQAIAADPGFGDAYDLRGLVYMRLGDRLLAEESFRRALAINPMDARALHNYGWLICQQGRHAQALDFFGRALADPMYPDRSKTFLTQGLCQLDGGRGADAQASFQRAYELDPANPITGYNLALLLFQRGEAIAAQFYLRRLNNSELANAQSLWLGIKVERRLDNRQAVEQLGNQLRKRFAQSRERASFDRGAFDE